MDNLPVRRLRELIIEYGDSLCTDQRRLAALLRDVCAGHKREINVLVNAVGHGVPAELLNLRERVPARLLFDRLTASLADEQGLSAEVARWAVKSWSFSLGLSETLPNYSPSSGIAAPFQSHSTTATPSLAASESQDTFLDILAGRAQEAVARLGKPDDESPADVRHLPVLAYEKRGVRIFLKEADTANAEVYFIQFRPAFEAEIIGQLSATATRSRVHELFGTPTETSIVNHCDTYYRIGGFDVDATIFYASDDDKYDSVNSKKTISAINLFKPGTLAAIKKQSDVNFAASQQKLAETYKLRLIPVTRINTEDVKSVRFSADGRFIATGHIKSGLRLWSTLDGSLVHTLGAESWYFTLNFITSQAAVSGLTFLDAGVWDIQLGRKQYALTVRDVLARDFAFSPDGKYLCLLTSSSIQFWHARSGALVTECQLDSPYIGDVAIISGDASRFAATIDRKTLRVWGIRRSDRLWSSASFAVYDVCRTGFSHGLRFVRFSPDARYLLCCDTWNNLNLVDALTGKSCYSKEISSFCVDFSQDGRMFASAESELVLRNTQTAEVLGKATRETETCYSAALSKNASFVAAVHGTDQIVVSKIEAL